MAFSRLRRWLPPRPRRRPHTEFRGYEYGWVLREVAGEARHPNRPAADTDRPAAMARPEATRRVCRRPRYFFR